MVSKVLQETEKNLARVEQDANIKSAEVRMAQERQDRLAKQKVKSKCYFRSTNYIT